VKKSLKLLVDNNDPRYLREKLREAFPELSAGDKLGAVFKFWQLRENRTELIALPVDVNNAQSLVNYMELSRSCVYIKAEVSLVVCLYVCLFGLAVWCSGNALVSINAVALHRARLVLRWLTTFGQVNCIIT